MTLYLPIHKDNFCLSRFQHTLTQSLVVDSSATYDPATIKQMQYNFVISLLCLIKLCTEDSKTVISANKLY